LNGKGIQQGAIGSFSTENQSIPTLQRKPYLSEKSEKFPKNRYIFAKIVKIKFARK
jgi:hypothetical protein